MIKDIFIEISRDTNIKYEYDKDLKALRLDRVLITPMVYPENYGYFPNTMADDGDALDVILIADYTIIPGSYISIRMVGVLDMEDEEGKDYKIIAVPSSKVDKTYDYVNDITDIPSDRLNKIKFFFENYKKLDKNKWAKVGSFMNKDNAERIYTECFV
tara:strand:+ start:82 stop:555 length:474 start_codon:yes stop_codon:yes gene_type:complete